VLANRVYLGEAVHKGVAYPGEHAAIIDQRTWDRAHAVMAEPAHRRGAATRAQIKEELRPTSAHWRGCKSRDERGG
jgi:hypothetical protein